MHTARIASNCALRSRARAFTCLCLCPCLCLFLSVTDQLKDISNRLESVDELKLEVAQLLAKAGTPLPSWITSKQLTVSALATQAYVSVCVCGCVCVYVHGAVAAITDTRSRLLSTSAYQRWCTSIPSMAHPAWRIQHGLVRQRST